MSRFGACRGGWILFAEDLNVQGMMANNKLARSLSDVSMFRLQAAINLERLATTTALPVASPSSNGGAAARIGLVVAGEVTPVRYEAGQQDRSGQEGNVHVCTHF